MLSFPLTLILYHNLTDLSRGFAKKVEKFFALLVLVFRPINFRLGLFAPLCLFNGFDNKTDAEANPRRNNHPKEQLHIVFPTINTITLCDDKSNSGKKINKQPSKNNNRNQHNRNLISFIYIHIIPQREGKVNPFCKKILHKITPRGRHLFVQVAGPAPGRMRSRAAAQCKRGGLCHPHCEPFKHCPAFVLALDFYLATVGGALS